MNFKPRAVRTPVVACAALCASVAMGDINEPSATPSSAPVPAISTVALTSNAGVVIESVEPTKTDKTVTWLGVAVEEAPEALSSQLGLKRGEGLVITTLAEDSPASRAELHKKDTLAEFDGQMLVDPHQLRKLVQMHAEGDTVLIKFYRDGKKQTVSVKLGKTVWMSIDNLEMSSMNSENSLNLSNLDALKGNLREMRESLARAGLDKARVDDEVRRTMEQTRKALQDAIRQAASSDRALVSVDHELEALARHGINIDKDATVIVRNRHNSTRTVVESDDDGTYVIEAGKSTHLTARDKHGKLLFEGDVDTADEQAKVPKEVWEKAKPMLDQVVAPKANDSKDKSEEKPNSRNKSTFRVS